MLLEAFGNNAMIKIKKKPFVVQMLQGRTKKLSTTLNILDNRQKRARRKP